MFSTTEALQAPWPDSPLLPAANDHIALRVPDSMSGCVNARCYQQYVHFGSVLLGFGVLVAQSQHTRGGCLHFSVGLFHLPDAK